MRSNRLPALLIGWPLRSVSPVSLARGASPVKERNSLAGAEPSGPTDDRGHRRGADLGQSGQAGRQMGGVGPAVGVGPRLGVSGELRPDRLKQPDLGAHLGG